MRDQSCWHSGWLRLISAEVGPAYGLAPVALMLVAAIVSHLWWLPHHVVNGWTWNRKIGTTSLMGWARNP